MGSVVDYTAQALQGTLNWTTTAANQVFGNQQDYYYILTGQQQQPLIAPTPPPVMDSRGPNVRWLDQRVDEMRVKLI